MADRRNGARRKRSARRVQVARDGDAAYARCRDMSDTGMKLDLTAPLELNDYVTVALSPSVVLCGTVVWVRGRECGVAFDGPVDSTALLDSVHPGRALEEAPTTLDLLNGRQAAERPVAAERARPHRCGVHFQPGLAVTVMVGPNHEQRGVVRWAKNNIAALELDELPPPYRSMP
jgi:hypothetical protein